MTPKPRRCALVGVGLCVRAFQGKQFLTAPSDDGKRLEWAMRLRWPMEIPFPPKAQVCSNHFEDGDIEVTKDGRTVARNRSVIPRQHVSSFYSNSSHCSITSPAVTRLQIVVDIVPPESRLVADAIIGHWTPRASFILRILSNILLRRRRILSNIFCHGHAIRQGVR